MGGHGSQITRRQETAIAALLVQSTVESAAKKAKVAYRTLKRWLSDATFTAAYRLERRRLVEHSVARMQQATVYAVTELLVLLQNGSETTKLAAAKILLEHSRDAVEVTEVMTRLEALESRLLAQLPTAHRNGVAR
jgi:hypothetical protein